MINYLGWDIQEIVDEGGQLVADLDEEVKLEAPGDGEAVSHPEGAQIDPGVLGDEPQARGEHDQVENQRGALQRGNLLHLPGGLEDVLGDLKESRKKK